MIMMTWAHSAMMASLSDTLLQVMAAMMATDQWQERMTRTLQSTNPAPLM